MPGHVDDLTGGAGAIESALYDGLGRPHEGVDGAVGGEAGVHIQQVAPIRGRDGICYRLDRLQYIIEDDNEFDLEMI